MASGRAGQHRAGLADGTGIGEAELVDQRSPVIGWTMPRAVMPSAVTTK